MRQRLRYGIILISFILMPATFYYFSPYLIIMGASQKVINGSFIVFAFLFILSLFIGRAFCGWLCPLAGNQEACFKVNDKKVNNKYNWIRYIIWVPWIGIIIYISVTAGGYERVNFLYQTEYGISVTSLQALTMYFLVVILTIILSLSIGKRAVCHYVCWMSPFMIAGRKLRNFFKWPSLRLKAEKDKCKNCFKCTKVCPMSLDVNQMVKSASMENPECILCGSCVDNCPDNIIKYSFSRER